MLANFVKISAAVITGFLQIKNEPTNSGNDRVESDLQLVNNCETWITDYYIKMLRSLKKPENNDEKRIILAAVSQIIAALLENKWGGSMLSA